MASLLEIIERDGGGCVWCGRELWRTDLTLEHLLPRSRGGRGTPENLAIACRACNRRRGTRSPAGFIREQVEEGLSPRLEALRHCLTRLAASPRRDHATFARRQLELLSRTAGGAAPPADAAAAYWT